MPDTMGGITEASRNEENVEVESPKTERLLGNPEEDANNNKVVKGKASVFDAIPSPREDAKHESRGWKNPLEGKKIELSAEQRASLKGMRSQMAFDDRNSKYMTEKFRAEQYMKKNVTKVDSTTTEAENSKGPVANSTAPLLATLMQKKAPAAAADNNNNINDSAKSTRLPAKFYESGALEGSIC